MLKQALSSFIAMLPRLITFDATNTLYQVKGSVGSIYKQMIIKYNGSCPYSSKEIQNEWSHSFSYMSKKFPNFGASTIIGGVQMTPREWWKILISRTFRNLDIEPFNTESAEYFWDDHIDHLFTDLYDSKFTSGSGWQLFDDVSILKTLKAQYPEILLGVVSNTDSRLNLILDSLGILSYFQYSDEVLTINSNSLGIAKPDPGIFSFALSMANSVRHEVPELSYSMDIKPSRCLHIGDHPHLDYDASLNSGWNSLLLDRTKKTPTSKYAIIPSLEQLPSLLKSGEWISKENL